MSPLWSRQIHRDRIEVPGGYEVGRNGELLFNGYRACIEDDEKVWV